MYGPLLPRGMRDYEEEFEEAIPASAPAAPDAPIDFQSHTGIVLIKRKSYASINI